MARTLDTFAPSPTAEVPLRIHWPAPTSASCRTVQSASASPAGAHSSTHADAAGASSGAALDAASAPPAPPKAPAPPLPALVLLPGGGWVTGNADLADSSARAIADAAGCPVVIATPQKAPEHPYPLPLTDSLAAYAWVTEHAAGLGIDPHRVGLAGDSAGGNLALATALALRDRAAFSLPAAGPRPSFTWSAPEAPAPAALALVYPVTDAGQDTPSYRDFAEGCGLTAARMAFYWDCYAPGSERFSPLVSVGRADLGGLPPVLLATAGVDVLRDECLALGDALRAAGNPLTQWDFPGMPHGFLHADGVLADGAALIDRLGAWLGTQLHGTGKD